MALLLPAVAASANPHRFFRIQVVDANTQAPLPGATLTTTNDVPYVTDLNGLVAYYEPGMMGQRVYFFVARPGYQFPAQFGFNGESLLVTEGGSAVVSLTPLPDAGVPLDGGYGDDATVLLDGGGKVPTPAELFGLQVIDDRTGRGLPLARVDSPGEVDYTDSSGLVAFYKPDALGTAVQFTASAHGYEPSADGGSSQVLLAAPGGSAVLSLHPVNVAQRLYRLTGEGIYRDTVMLGRPAPLANPLLDSQVMGQDSCVTALYRGEVFWIFGDTGQVSFPLGNFSTTGARSLPPDAGGLAAEVGVDLQYYGNGSGFVGAMFPPDPSVPGGGPVWLDGLVDVPDVDGGEALFIHYAKIAGNFVTTQYGMARFDDASSTFQKVFAYPDAGGVAPQGKAMLLDADGARWAYYQDGTRVLATAVAMSDPAAAQAFTPLVAGSASSLERDPDGGIVYDWKTGTPPLTAGSAAEAGTDAGERLYGHLRDVETGAAFEEGGGHALEWNPYRQRFLRISTQIFGAPSFFGEVYYSEGDTPMGGWVDARKIITHDDYTFYNPELHPFLSENEGSTVFFEGTYSAWLSNAVPTPRYNYNQQMYELDLKDPRLFLPAAVYGLSADSPGASFGGKSRVRPWMSWLAAPFLAPDQPMPGTAPVWWSGPACAERTLQIGGTPGTEPLFYALPGATSSPPPNAVGLFDYVNAQGSHRYGLAGAAFDGFTAGAAPLVYVWRNPVAVALPVASYLAALVADSGPDQCVVETAPGQGAQVRLDGSRTSDRAGTVSSYQWSWSGGSATGVNPMVALPVGVHWVQLTVTDDQGQSSASSVVIQVAAAPAPSSDGGSPGGADGGGAPAGPGTKGGCGCDGSSGGVAALLALWGLLALRARTARGAAGRWPGRTAPR